MKITTIVFTVTTDDSQKAYEKFINLLALRGYSFTVSRKDVASACRKFFVEIDDLSDSDMEYATFNLGGKEDE